MSFSCQKSCNPIRNYHLHFLFLYSSHFHFPTSICTTTLLNTTFSNQAMSCEIFPLCFPVYSSHLSAALGCIVWRMWQTHSPGTPDCCLPYRLLPGGGSGDALQRPQSKPGSYQIPRSLHSDQVEVHNRLVNSIMIEIQSDVFKFLFIRGLSAQRQLEDIRLSAWERWGKS